MSNLLKKKKYTYYSKNVYFCNQIYIVFIVSVICATAWSFITTDIIFFSIFSFDLNNSAIPYIIIALNSLGANALLFYANPKKFLFSSTNIKIIKICLVTSFYIGIHFLIIYFFFLFGDQVFMEFFILCSIVLSIYVILTRLTFRKKKIILRNLLLNNDRNPECPNCKMNIDEESILILNDQTFFFCQYCGEKIRCQQIVEVDEKLLLEEHKKVLNKLNSTPINDEQIHI